MIEHVRTVGFKGFDLDEDVPKKVIYTGRNKSGKSTRAGAIAIALYGHIPFSTAGKLPGDILESFGKDELIASVTINGHEFARKFSRNSKGGVSQSVQIDKKKTSKENFAILLNNAGGPRIADVAEFMKQSDAKKTDTLFELYPNDDLYSIDIEIEDAKEDVSRLEKKKSGAESVVIHLTNSKQDFVIPSGNIAETQAEIKTVESQIVDLEEKIKQAEIEEAEEKAKEEGRIEGERLEKERVEKEAAEKKVDPIDDIPMSSDAKRDEAIISEGERQIEDHKSSNGMDENQDLPNDMDNRVFSSEVESKTVMLNPADSIHRIIDALKGAGCGTCAALIVAKQELKKFKEVS